jgi:hypothetical protein
MTIEKGKPWGSEILVPDSVLSIQDDYELARIQQSSLCVMTGGDLWRALGEPITKTVGNSATAVEVDAFEITIIFQGHRKVVIASSSVEIGSWVPRSLRKAHRYVALTNSGILSGCNIAPRAHPNDGYIHVMTVEASMPLMQRVMSRRRAKTGSHIPHPNISVSRINPFEAIRESRNETLRIDGRTIREWDSLTVRVLPDYWNVII